MSSQNMPPWLQEQIVKLQQAQMNLQSIVAQRQQAGIEQAETDKALEELRKAGDSDAVYKHAGSIMVKSTKQDLISELEEKKELAKTRDTVLEKQEARLKESLKQQEAKITEMMQGGTPGQADASDVDSPRR